MTEKKIMLVDDSPGHISLLGGILESEYDLLVANNGMKALELVKTELPDLILLDVIMPGLDGYEVCRQLKAGQTTKDIPVIFSTASTAPDEIAKGLAVGAAYYLTKPIDTKILKAVVKSILAEQDTVKTLKEEVSSADDVLSHFMYEGKFKFRTLDDAYKLTILLAKFCPQPMEIVMGLRELLINAVEHGNLGLSYEQKKDLCEENR